MAYFGVGSCEVLFGNYKRAISALGIILSLLLFCTPSFAQLNLGRIYGTVTDQSGGAIAGATVTVIDVARGISRPLISDGAGEYDASSIIPGTYTVRVEAKGFKIEEHTAIEVGVGKEVRVDLTLQPGEQTTTVTVTGDLPLVNTSDAELGRTLDQMTVQEIPIEGRNYQYLLGTRPGVIMHPGQGTYAFASDGVDTHFTGWMIDGLGNANAMVGGPSLIGGQSPAGDEGSILPLDAIQEVQIIENPNAVYGDRPGAHVNVGLKSGTNSLHGTAYAFGKDGGWAARNPFLASGLPKQPLAFEQFGASVGGPIKKDKVFYFANYEGQRYSVGVPRITQEPTTADIGGTSGVADSIPDAVYDILHNGANTAGLAPSALSLNLAGCSALVPAGSVTAAGYLSASQVAVLKSMSTSQLAAGCNAAKGLFGNAGSSQNEVTDLVSRGGSDNGIIKVDMHPSSHDSLNFEWFDGGGNVISAGSAVQPYWEGQGRVWDNMARGVWIWTPNSTWLNEFRFGYDYGNLPTYVLECDEAGIGPNYAALGFVSGTPPCESGASPGHDVYGGFPNSTITGFGGLAGTTGQDGFQNTYTALDNVTWTHGTHTVTFGMEFRYLVFEGDVLTNGRGTLSFGSISSWAASNVSPCTSATCPAATALEDFMSGVTASGALLVGNALRTVRRPSYATYVQDSWRALRRLTINAGIRYEYAAVIKDANNQLANFNPALGSPTGLFQETSSQNIYAPYPWNFGPRLGIAWDVTGNGKTVVHVGGSVMFESAPRMLDLTGAAPGGGGIVNELPTGFTFVNPNGSTFAGPGNIATGTVNEAGGLPGAAGNSLPWSIGNPVFNASASGLKCGNGQAASLAGGAAGVTNPPPCQISPYDLHDRAPYYITRTISVQHAFTNNLSVDVAYVGNEGRNIDGIVNINAPTPGAKNSATNGYIEQARRPYYTQFPFYSDILFETHGQESNYNALQASLTQRISQGLNFTVGYTLSHNLDDKTGSGNTYTMNPLNPILDYGNSVDNAPNNLTFTMTYLVPGVKSPGQILEGWQLNTAVDFLSGFSVNAVDTSDDLSGVEGSGVGADRWTMTRNDASGFHMGGPGTEIPCYGVAGSSFAKSANCVTVASVANMPALCQTTAAAEPVNPSILPGSANSTGLLSLASFGCYSVGSVAIVPPAQGTFGGMARDMFYTKPYHNWDFSATKNWKFKERYGVQFRAEFFNILNRTLYGSPTASLNVPSSFGEATATPDSGNPVLGNGPRKIQLGLKLSF